MLSSPTVDIINQDLTSNIVEAAEYGLKSGKVKQVIALQHPPSYDSGTAAALRKLANTELQKTRDKSDS